MANEQEADKTSELTEQHHWLDRYGWNVERQSTVRSTLWIEED